MPEDILALYVKNYVNEVEFRQYLSFYAITTIWSEPW